MNAFDHSPGETSVFNAGCLLPVQELLKKLGFISVLKLLTVSKVRLAFSICALRTFGTAMRM